MEPDTSGSAVEVKPRQGKWYLSKGEMSDCFELLPVGYGDWMEVAAA